MSGSNKFGRGPGRGMNRMVRVPPPMGRGMVSLGRGMSAGKDKGRGDEIGLKGRGMKMTGSAIGANNTGRCSQEEKFELVTCREQEAAPLFAMAVRLTPGLLETLKRGEELGETASIKFGPPNSGANVIKVSGEEFKFVLATEPGHLCDIYEEQRRGDDGNGLLVESGAVWRKLSVTRTLSATDKNRVKARSAEAELQKNHRKAIILDHNNALMNKQVAASGEVNGRRAPMMKAKKEPPPKKAKLTAGAPGVPSFSAPKSRTHPTIAEKSPAPAVAAKVSKPVVAASSPELPPVAPSRAPVSGSQGAGAAAMPPLKPKGAALEEAGAFVPPKPMTAGSQKDKASSPALTPLGGGSGGSDAGKIAKASSAGIVSTTELRNCLITLLTDNPKGMTIKAVEKALGEAHNVRPQKKQIEKVIKAIASYHAPGKYMLKNGVEKGAFTKPSPGSASSLETGPVDSPPLADSPALMESVPEAQVPGGIVQSGGGGSGDGGERSGPQPLQESKKLDGTGLRTTSIPGRRGTESPMHRAIRRPTEISRANADRLQQTGHQDDNGAGIAVGVESPSRHRHPTKAEEDHSSVKEGTIPPETTAEGDHVSIGGDESPLVDSPPDNAHERKINSGDVEERHIEDNQNVTQSQAASPRSTRGGSDSSSGSSGTSGSESDSESESASSRSGTASDTDSDASSSSPSDEEKKVVGMNMVEAIMDEDVDIMSSDDDDEDGKAVMDLTATPKHQKPKSKELQQEAKIQKQLSRKEEWLTKKPRQIDTDVAAMTYRSEDADNDEEEETEGRGERKGDVWEEQDGGVAEKGLKAYNSDEEVDVVSCEEDTPPLQKQGVASPAESGKHNGDGAGEEDADDDGNDDAVDVNPVGDVKDHTAKDDDLQTVVGPKSGSESDHSIEEYETRAENSGVRGAKVKVVGDQKAEVGQQQQGGLAAEGIEGVPSPRSGAGINGSINLAMENVSTVGKQNKTDGGSSGPMGKGVLSNSTKNHKTPSGASLRQPSGERSSLLGMPPPGATYGTSQVGSGGGGGTRMGREPPNKDKAIESKKGDGESSVGGRVGGKAVVDTGQIQDRGLPGHPHRGPPQRSSKVGFDNPGRSGKAASNALQVPNGLPRLSEVPGATTAKGLDISEEGLTPDYMVKTSFREADTAERLDAQQRRPNSREGGPPLGKPGKGSAGLPGRAGDGDQISGRGQVKGAAAANLAAGGRPGKNPKQTKKAGVGRGDVLERVSGGPFHEVGVDVAGPMHQRRPSRDWETHRKSSPQKVAAESGSRVGDDNEPQQNANRVAEFQKADPDRPEATSAGVLAATVSNTNKARGPRMTPDSEQLNELRDLVAGDDFRTRDSSLRSEKLRESSDMPLSRPPPPPPPHRAHISPDQERPGPGKAFGKPGDVKKRSPAVRNVLPQKPDVPVSLRENVSRPPAVNASSKQGLGGGHEDRLEFGSNRTLEGGIKVRAVPVVGDNHEKAPPAAVEGSRIRKRPAEEGGDHDPGRPAKRVAAASDSHDAPTAPGRGESDVGAATASNKQERGSSTLEGPGRGPSVDAVKRISTDGNLNINQRAVNHVKAVGENGRVMGAKTKGHDVLPDNNKELAEKQRGLLVQLDGKQQQQKAATTAGPVMKMEMQSNGRRRPPSREDLQGPEFFAKYEKRHAEQKGPILSYDQYLDYSKEYNEKYQVYVTLHTHLDTNKEDFVNFSKAISSAKAAEDKEHLAAIYMNVTSNYVQSHKRFKRMRSTFNVLHDELRAIKQRCKEYAEKTAS